MKELKLANVAARCAAKESRAAKPVAIDDAKAVESLAKSVVSGRLFAEGGKTYRVIWIPVQ